MADTAPISSDTASPETTSNKIVKSDAEWRSQLTTEQYFVLRQHGTERAFTGPYLGEKRDGLYRCVACDAPLFRSETKYESGSGWPSFFAPVSPEAVTLIEDVSHGMRRIEVRCGRCEGHLGHVFPDGPKPTGARFCMNGTALSLEPDAKDGE